MRELDFESVSALFFVGRNSLHIMINKSMIMSNMMMKCKNITCEYEWEPRKANPKCCPVCKQYLMTQSSPVITSGDVDMPAENWQGWTEEKDYIDYESGQTIYYRENRQTGKRKEIRRETYFE